MKKTIDRNDFKQEFASYDRADQFTAAGLDALYNALADYEEDTGTEFELDVIALCCEFTEYDSLDEFRANYGDDYETIEDVEQNTWVIPIPGTDGFIIQDF